MSEATELDPFDDHDDFDVPEDEDEFDCPMFWSDGQWHCPLLGSEECDWECPHGGMAPT